MLAAGLAQLAEHPVRLSYDDIANRAGVNKTTIYRNWPDTGSLIADALDAETARAPRIADGPPAARLRALAHDAVRWYRTPANRATVATLLAAAQHETQVAEAFRRYWTRRFAPIDNSDDPRAAAAAELLAAQCTFHTLTRARPVTDEDIERWITAAIAGASWTSS
ncbi:hypothetical protein ASU32_19010 [Tsukamurella tyrosinosolvens]|nr:hypothetical protein ASU32_19010 [Tsukamurella tyrosinosolvens]